MIEEQPNNQQSGNEAKSLQPIMPRLIQKGGR
jgi:hypothetical protein